MPSAFSTMMPLGTLAPDFKLYNTVSGIELSLSEIKGEKGTVIMFICNHCPYVIHIQDQLKNISDEYMSQGISFVAISSNDIVNFPEDSPELMKKFSEEGQLDFPYLYDETQEVAKAYKAECTPDFFLFDVDLKCAYRGRFDSSSPGNGVPSTGEDLRMALGNLVVGIPIDTEQHPSIGCSIKWKK
ncbi:MAG: thioredoxin family protein [Reichenbachiella sp.]